MNMTKLSLKWNPKPDVRNRHSKLELAVALAYYALC